MLRDVVASLLSGKANIESAIGVQESLLYDVLYRQYPGIVVCLKLTDSQP